MKPPGECWLWDGRTDARGYGRICLKRDGPARDHLVHVVVYECFVGPVPDGHELDHLCRVHGCFNPAHVEPVTHVENMRRSFDAIGHNYARRTHCKQGHPYDEANTRWYRGYRVCRACRHAVYRANRQAKLDAARGEAA